MKYVFYLLLTLLAAVVVAGLAHVSNGHALLAYGRTSLEMSLGTLLVLVFVTFFGLYLLTTLAVPLWTFPRRLRQALALVDVRLLDHFIVGDGHCFSFSEHGLL